jgi:predicted dehydrogenase
VIDSQRLRWGVLSTARIGVRRVIPALQAGQHCQVVAIASRDEQAAKAAAENLGIPRAYGSYDSLLSDPEVEAVYIPLPNHLHIPWAIRCIEAGKHVLCEKPLALTADEGDRLVRAAADRPRLKVMEAFMYRHHPQWDMALQRLREGGVGDLRSVQAAFSIHSVNPDDIRNQAATGGGGLLDIGCY